MEEEEDGAGGPAHGCKDAFALVLAVERGLSLEGTRL